MFCLLWIPIQGTAEGVGLLLQDRRDLSYGFREFQALSGIIAQEGVRPVWEQRGVEHSQTIPCPFGECLNHTESPAHLLCAWYQPRGARKEIRKKNTPDFWNSAGHFPSFAWLCHWPPAAAARDTRCLSPRVTLAFQWLM